MKVIPQTVIIGLALCLLSVSQPLQVRADVSNDPSLVISQLKITSSNGQFITLYNPTSGMVNMGAYQLEYFNNFDLTKATSSKLIALSGMLPPHGYFMVSDGALLLCYQLTVDSVSLGLSSTAGLVEVLDFNQTSPGGSVMPRLDDFVGWSKTAANGAQTLPSSTNAFLLRQPVDAQSNPAIMSPGAGSWQAVQPDPNNACALTTAAASNPTTVTTGLNQLLPATEPPAIIIALANTSTVTTPQLPPADIGLMAPRITEILPNPLGTGNDTTDEFIEVYNPNSQTFDLSGFSLQAGTTSLHHFTFPNGTSLPPQSFTAFYAKTTGLSLSNSAGQVALLDPLGNNLSATDAYGTAKDGQAWTLANGSWYWTSTPTPGQPNSIKQTTTSKTSKAKAASKTTAVKGVQAAKLASSSSTAGGDSEADDLTPIHNWVLATVATLALLYGAYEYRHDLANYFVQLRTNRRARRANRAAPERR